MAALANRDEIEKDFALRLSRVQTRHRKELEGLLGNPPDPANVPQWFWDKVEKENRETMTAILLLIFLTAADQHSGPFASDELKIRSEGEGLAWALKRGHDLARDFTTRSIDWLSKKGQKWKATGAANPAAVSPQPPVTVPPQVPAPSVPQAQVSPQASSEPVPAVEPDQPAIPTPRITEDLLDIFGPNRQEGIAISETTGAASAGGEWMIHATGQTRELDQWITEEDRKVCPICQPLHKKRRSVWTLKFPQGPPAHVRCRCYIRYAKENSTPEEN